MENNSSSNYFASWLMLKGYHNWRYNWSVLLSFEVSLWTYTYFCYLKYMFWYCIISPKLTHFLPSLASVYCSQVKMKLITRLCTIGWYWVTSGRPFAHLYSLPIQVTLWISQWQQSVQLNVKGVVIHCPYQNAWINYSSLYKNLYFFFNVFIFVCFSIIYFNYIIIIIYY